MKRLLFPVLLLLLSIGLSGDIWYYHPDPELNQGDWRADEYYYYDWEAYSVSETITSPFYQYGSSHLNALNQGPDSDFQPEDGWNLYAANFGEQAGTGSGFPLFVLYNKYTGVLRIFMYKTLNAAESYTYIAMEVTYNGNSTLFSLGEENMIGGVKALDKRDELEECSFISINEMGTSYNNWYYIDLNVMYDPVVRIGEPSIFIRLYGSEESTIDTNIDLCGQYSSTNVSNNSSIIDLGRSIYTHYKDGADLGEQVQNFLDDQYIDVLELDITPQNKIFSLLAHADIVTDLLGGANALYGLYKHVTAGGGGSNVSSLFHLHGELNGTMETINNLRTSDIYESYSGRTLDTHYSETMGVFNLVNTPQIEHAEVIYGDITGAHTYRVSSDLLAYVINPAAGLNSTVSDLEVALEFDVSFINGHWSWIEEATGYTFADLIEMGCLDEIGATWLGNGFRTRYTTQFVPVSSMNGLAFTIPFPANSVSLKTRSIIERSDDFAAEDVVVMINYAVDINNIGETDDFFDFIPPQQLVSVYESTVISGQDIDLNNVYSIECGSDLRFQDCNININSAGYGFNINHGQLIFNNCQINMEGNFIYAAGAESEVILESGSILNMNDCTIELTDQAHLYLEESELNMEDSRLELSGSSRVNLTDNCQFTTNGSCEIIGATSEYWFDPVDYYNVSFPTEYGAEICIPGDRITIENSLIDFDDETEIKGQDGAKWDGIYFLNCSINCQDPTECGKLRGSISDIHFLDFENSNVTIECADISDIGQIKVHNDSHIYIYYLNYYNNERGIFSSESEVSINTSNIHNNGGNGLIVTNSFYPQNILNSNIYENEGIGLDIHNCFYNVSGSSIYNNQTWGYANLGSVQNLILQNSEISNNGYAELVSIADCFPQFHASFLGAPSIFDDDISSDPTDLYLLMALGPVEAPINLENLVIDTENSARFYPNLNSFIFDPLMNLNASLLYLQGLEYFKEENYLMAMQTMKDVIDLYPETDEAKKALAMLPYICKAIDGDTEALIQYIDQLPSEDLQEKKDETKAIISLFDKNYDEAIYHFEEIIADPPGDQEQLLAELNEAFCYYQLTISGERDLPDNCRHKPQTGIELVQIQNDIRERLLGSDHQDEMMIPAAEVINCVNYPNPFNPSTSISFQVSGTGGKFVELEIFNLKGQKIRSIDCKTEPVEVSENQTKYLITWDGNDDNNSPVTSGVYFYQVLVAGRKKAVKKCLLLK
jgi:tetratricopeptide (TPR) repeat protein